MSSDYSFGSWVRRRRKSLDFTQAYLAQQVGCALVTIKKIERDERRPSRQMAQRLADCLGLQNSERVAFIQAALSQRSPDRLPPPDTELILFQPHVRLPQPATQLIGRRKEISRAVWLLRHQARLLTITGTGGVGKTRLALAIAQEMKDEFRNGVVFISMASIQDPDLVPAKIAQELKLKECGDEPVKEMLLKFFSNQEMLLLLDNFDHLISSAPFLAILILNAPNLRVLVTSRIILRLSCEILLTLYPLKLPEPPTKLSDDLNFRRIARSEAIRLFVQRAKAQDPAFRLTKENCHQVASICEKLDGLPLAIELAASRVREYPLVLLHEGLSRRLDLLSDGFHDLPARQQTLRNTFDWSFNLLEKVEQLVFPCFGVFLGGFTMEAASAICLACSPDEVYIAIGGLVDKNMILRTEIGDRYHLLDTAQEYALERLEASEQLQNVRKAHLSYFTQMAEEAAPNLWDKDQGEWLQRLAIEVDNLRGALKWSLQREAENLEEINLGAQLAASLWYFWYLFGALREGESWLALALSRIPQINLIRARLLLANGALTWQQGKLRAANNSLGESVDIFRLLEDLPNLAESTHIYGHVVFDQQNFLEAERLFKEALSIYESLEDKIIRIVLISDLGLVAYHQHDYLSARRYYETSLELFINHGIKDGEAASYIRLGDLARLEDNHKKANDLYEKSLQIYRELEIRIEIACSLHKLGFTALHRGEIYQAQSLFYESLALQSEIGNQQGIAECLAGFASVKVFNQEYLQAARYFGAAKQILSKTGLPISPADLAEWQRDEEVARSRCDLKSFEQAWLQGLEEVVETMVSTLLADNQHGNRSQDSKIQ